MVDLHPYVAPDGLEALRVWITGSASLTGIPVRANRRPGDTLPYIMLTRPSTVSDLLTETGVYRVHAFHEEGSGQSAMKRSYDLATLVNRRIAVLNPRYGGGQVPVTVNGVDLYADSVDFNEGPTREKYTEDGSIEQYITDITIAWRLLAA